MGSWTELARGLVVGMVEDLTCWLSERPCEAFLVAVKGTVVVGLALG